MKKTNTEKKQDPKITEIETKIQALMALQTSDHILFDTRLQNDRDNEVWQNIGIAAALIFSIAAFVLALL